MKDINFIYEEVAKFVTQEFTSKRKKVISKKFNADDIKYLHRATIDATIRFLSNNQGVRWDYIASFFMLPETLDFKKRVKEMISNGAPSESIIKMLNDEYPGIKQMTTFQYNTKPLHTNIKFNANRDSKNK